MIVKVRSTSCACTLLNGICSIIGNSFLEGEWMMSFHLLQYTQLTKVFLPHWRLQILPVHCLTLQYCYSSSPVHHGSKRGETDGSCRRHQYSPVYRRLVNENNSKLQYQENTHSLVHLVKSLGWITIYYKSDLFPTQGINVLVTNPTSG